MQHRVENSPIDQSDWDGEQPSTAGGAAHSDGRRVVEMDSPLPRSWEGEAGAGSNELLLREILENLSQGVAVYDADGCLFAWNQSMRDLFDLPDHLMKVGTNWHAISAFLATRGDYGDGDPEELSAARLAMLTRDHMEPVEMQLRNDLHYEVTSRPLHGGARLFSFYDITEQKRAEAEMKAQRDELARSNLMKDKLFSIVAHDLRSPFNTLLGFAQLIADHAEKATRQELGDYAREINRSGSRLLQLVDNLLRWSRSQMGDTKFQATDQMLSPIIHGVTELQRKIAEEKGITLHTDLTDDFVTIDRDIIESLLRNLVNNAIKFTKPGGEVTIQVRPLGEDRMEILVKDSGVGISSEQLDSLFEFTDRQSTTGTLGEPGTGLGLQICGEFAAAHGGEIHVESELGVGSTFRFSVPKAV